MSHVLPAVDDSARRATGTAGPAIMAAVVWAAAVIALAAPAIKTGVFNAMSTDDAMRLVEVRDLIAGQGWFDLVQHRLDPPGLAMHWSRVIDAPLAALIALLRPLAGAHNAEAIVLVLWPSLLLGAAFALVMAIAGRMAADRNRPTAQLVALVLAALAAPALIHFRAGAIDHHNAQIVLLLALVWLAPDAGQGAIRTVLAACAASLSLAIGLEMLPAIAAACVAVAGLLVWRGGAVSRTVGLFGVALAASSLLLAAGLLPLSSLAAPVCDAFGGPVLLLIAGGGASLLIVAAADRLRPTLGTRCAAAAFAGIVLLGAVFNLFPGCVASPYAQVAPLLKTFWLDRVIETMSFARVLELTPEKLLGYYGFPLIALGLASAALIRCAPQARFRWIVAVVTLAALTGISLWQMRGAAAATIVAAPLFAAALDALWPGQPVRRLILVALAVSPACLTALGLAAQPALAWILGPRSTIVATDPAASCRTVSGVAPLAALPPGRMMAPIDLGPAILAASSHTVFAAPYHRNNDGNLAMVETMLAAPEAARKILSGRAADYVVICAGSPDQMEFVARAPQGLAARLGRGERFDFLAPLALDAAAGLKAWRVVR